MKLQFVNTATINGKVEDEFEIIKQANIINVKPNKLIN